MNILRAEAYLRTTGYPSNTKLADVYDDDEMLQSALCTLFPGFEYPDFSYKTLAQILAQYERAPLPIG